MARIAAVMIAAILAGCASDGTPDPPKLRIPDKPYASDVPCEPLTDQEREVCRQQGPDEQRVCKKVARNKLICDGRGQWIEDVHGAYGTQ